MGCVDFTRLRWPSQIWAFEGSLSITSSIPFAGSGTTGHAVLQLNASSGTSTVSADMQEGIWVAGPSVEWRLHSKPKGNENPLIGICLSFQGQLDEIYPHSVSDLRAV